MHKDTKEFAYFDLLKHFRNTFRIDEAPLDDKKEDEKKILYYKKFDIYKYMPNNNIEKLSKNSLGMKLKKNHSSTTINTYTRDGKRGSSNTVSHRKIGDKDFG